MKKNKQIIATGTIAKKVSQLKKQGKKVVLTQGSFDLVHIGHARYCAEAKSYGDILIVGVDSDAKVKKRKGEDRPIVPQDERMEMLTHLDSVDFVVLKKLNVPKWDLIKKVQPDILIATKETYTNEQLEALKEFCGKVVVLEPQATTSTSAKIRLMQIGLAQKIADTLTKKLQRTIDTAFKELKEEA
jgi:D-beta-D-heptose 7-phosphate kinase/D-beta-D-heptose 1-phosphate adenosyltransferase